MLEPSVHHSASRRGMLIFALTVLVSALALMVPVGEARAQGKSKPPELGASAWVVIDANDEEVLASKAPRRSLPIASATKMMTAFVALRDLDLDQRLQAADYSPLPVESVLGLQAGERMSVRDLITAMMLPSANDAAVTVAEGVSGTQQKFVKRMNRAAAGLGLNDSSFANPIGLDDPLNFSSASDLVTLGRELRRNRFFRKTVAKTEATLTTGATTRRIETRNTLARSDSSVDGIKTGHTQGAGYVLVASAERDGVELISAVLGASSEAARDAESSRLLDYGFSLYKERSVVRRQEALAAVAVEGESETLELLTRGAIKLNLRQGEETTVDLDVPGSIERAVSKGERLGRARILVGGNAVASAPLYASRAVAEPDSGSVAEEAGVAIGLVLIVGGSIVLVVALALAVRRNLVGGERREISVRDQQERERSQRQRARERRGGTGSAR